MIQHTKDRWLVMSVTAVILSGVICIWFYRDMNQSIESARQATTSLAECERLSTEIADLQVRSRDFRWVAPAGYRPGQAIDQALKSAAISSSNLSVSSSPGRTFPGSTYRESTIDIPTLEKISLEQAIRFLYALATSNPSHQINRAAFTANNLTPTNSDSPPTWNLDCDISFFSATDNKGDRSSRNR